ncbi:LytTR family DNA-binding domain-containing protein [Evansella sp. AB-P1]|uniref:LytTR family DNA-binding domain-containing protein n=1 Tax=Evansella sp. AB-P1 TaxID=3037653 RepID=UPI0024204E36|nr:LytTR family DNA-binding domain-containing protein [Evansella sp. AB-P1]MDG5788533.1 LytTR family DNA-binding domain-containing protein [Evansella sp. AB-P1]
MKINFDLNDDHEETYITIHAKEWSEELEELAKRLNHRSTKRILGMDKDKSILLYPNDIDYIYAEKRKVFASVKKQSIELTLKLYELEDMLSGYQFSRFSKSVIGNLQQIKYFQLVFNGNLCVIFNSGSKEYVSRKYALQIKEKLIMGVGNDGI